MTSRKHAPAQAADLEADGGTARWPRSHRALLRMRHSTLPFTHGSARAHFAVNLMQGSCLDLESVTD